MMNSKIILSTIAIAAIGVVSISSLQSQSVAEDGGQKAMPKKEIKPLNKTDLTDMQKYVTQHDGTEPPFNNAYWDNHEDGIYVDITSGEPLFSSVDKFNSGTGWPSFTKPIAKQSVASKTDNTLFMSRTEVRSSTGDAHLGHVFDDGPKDKGGKRYCINSAALKFIPKADLEKEGYGEYSDMFK